MTPMFIVGILLSITNVTELVEGQLGETGHIIYEVTMVLLAIGFLFGILGYQKMLKRLK